VFTYTEKGQLIKRQRYGGGLDFEEIKTYDSQGRVASKANSSNQKDPNYQKVTYAYDEKGNLVKEIGYSKQGREGTNTYSYEFDSSGNWVKRTALREWDWLFGRQDRGTEIAYRTITYYE
jgi:antitoxin component YwqK of YwqJK toxin-antitoxin module